MVLVEVFNVSLLHVPLIIILSEPLPTTRLVCYCHIVPTVAAAGAAGPP
jgi:hypothetical protein